MQHHAPRSSFAFKKKTTWHENSYSLLQVPMERESDLPNHQIGDWLFEFPTTQVLKATQPKISSFWSFQEFRTSKKDFSLSKFAYINHKSTTHFQIISFNCFQFALPKMLSPKLSPPLCSSVWLPPFTSKTRSGRYHQITGSKSQWQKYHQHIILHLH